jgi:hypothetical protein
MKKYIVLAFAALLLSMMGCSSALFHATVTFNHPRTWKITQTGAFNQPWDINKNDILSKLNIPTDARITKVEIRSITITPAPLSDNVATEIICSATANGKGLFSNQPVYIAGAKAGQAGIPKYTAVGLKFLIALGINQLKSNIDAWVKKVAGAPTSISGTFSGNTNPANQKISMNIILTINATVEYDYCKSVPKPMFEVDECNITEALK